MEAWERKAKEKLGGVLVGEKRVYMGSPVSPAPRLNAIPEEYHGVFCCRKTTCPDPAVYEFICARLKPRRGRSFRMDGKNWVNMPWSTRSVEYCHEHAMDACERHSFEAKSVGVMRVSWMTPEMKQMWEEYYEKRRERLTGDGRVTDENRE